MASDVDASLLRRLRQHVRDLPNVRVRRIDISKKISGLYDLVTLFFVIHRLKHWKHAIDRLQGLVAPGGFFYLSEFAGPSGVIRLANERGGHGRDPVSRLIRRYFELVNESFRPELKSTNIRPVLDRMRLEPAGHRDFHWRQPITVAEMHHKIEREVYAPFFSTHPNRAVLERLRQEFKTEWRARAVLVETIRIYRFASRCRS